MEAIAHLYNGGRVTIPIQIRQALGMSDGEDITFQLKDGELKIVTIKQQLEKAREILRQTPAWEKLSVDDFIRERRLEAKREIEEYGDIDTESHST